MRIKETTYKTVSADGQSYEVTMRRIKGLRLRELVRVGKAKSDKREHPCSSENTTTR